jgi:peptidyl-dipeptidase Dcp
MEHWAAQPEVLDVYAKHYKTGETIPNELVDKLTKAGKFNQGFGTVEYLAASFLDMDYHTINTPGEVDIDKFESKSMKNIDLMDEIIPRYKSTYFAHIFSGGYSSGYYSYIWAEVLDADAFEAYKEAGNIYDKETAKSFRENILERGGTDDAMELYIKFRGKKPVIGPLLENRGLN